MVAQCIAAEETRDPMQRVLQVTHVLPTCRRRGGTFDERTTMRCPFLVTDRRRHIAVNFLS
eukprot:2189659-Rhodomonas_salina.2